MLTMIRMLIRSLYSNRELDDELLAELVDQIGSLSLRIYDLGINIGARFFGAWL